MHFVLRTRSDCGCPVERMGIARRGWAVPVCAKKDDGTPPKEPTQPEIAMIVNQAREVLAERRRRLSDVRKPVDAFALLKTLSTCHRERRVTGRIFGSVLWPCVRNSRLMKSAFEAVGKCWRVAFYATPSVFLRGGPKVILMVSATLFGLWLCDN